MSSEPFWPLVVVCVMVAVVMFFVYVIATGVL